MAKKHKKRARKRGKKTASKWPARAFYWGTASGSLASALYIGLGGRLVLFIPAWAELVFAPGFWVGRWAYRQDLPQIVMATLGCLAVGLTYGMIAVTVAALWRKR